MRYLLLTALAILAASATAAFGQPSFNCGGSLNPTERTICGNSGLARLDVQMADTYRTILATLNQDRAQAFRNRQIHWRRGRDACGVSVSCIQANYVARLYDFGALSQQSFNLSTGPAPTPDAVVTVLPDGTMERRTPDGRLVRRLPNGTVERYLPDGTKLPPTTQFSNVQVGTLPPLPPQLQNWGNALQQTLHTVIDNMLTDDELSAYAATEGGKQDYELIDWRLRSVLFLTQSQ